MPVGNKRSPVVWSAEWINAGHGVGTEEIPVPNPVFRKEITLRGKPEQAIAYISGLGNYELFINGKKAGCEVLSPGASAYDKTVYYNALDVTDLLSSGENCIAVMLGRGRYAMTTDTSWKWHQAPWMDEPCLLFQLEMAFADSASDTVISNGEWKCSGGPILYDSLYGGETYDAQMEEAGWMQAGFSDKHWQWAIETKGPKGKLMRETIPPIRKIKSVAPVSIRKYKDDVETVHIVDFGTVLAGWARIQVTCTSGTVIRIRYGERLNADGTLFDQQGNVFGRFQTDIYITKGGSMETWEPRFSYKGFRYIEITGWPGELPPEGIQAVLVHSDLPVAGGFTCSDGLVNKIHFHTRKTFSINTHSIPTDTPTYEKNGWSGDVQLIAETALYNFDMKEFLFKWIGDLVDTQTDAGELAPIAPTTGWGLSTCDFGWKRIQGALPAWDAALLLVPWDLYQFYGDTAILMKYYSNMQKYLQYLDQYITDGIVSAGLGDWLPPAGGPNLDMVSEPPEGASLCSTAYAYQLNKVMAEISRIVGDEQCCHQYLDKSAEIYIRFNRQFFNQDKRHYETPEIPEYRQTSNIIPLAFGLVPEHHRAEVVQSLVADIASRNNCLNTGFIGTRHLLPVLLENGQVETAWKVITSRSYPSWGFWFENGIDSLAEAWELTSRSLGHYAFGSVDACFFKYFAGIRPAQPGFGKIILQPHFPEKLDFVKAWTMTPFGKVESEWKRQGGTIHLSYDIPEGSQANLVLPSGDKVALPHGNTILQVDDRTYQILTTG